MSRRCPILFILFILFILSDNGREPRAVPISP